MLVRKSDVTRSIQAADKPLDEEGADEKIKLFTKPLKLKEA